MLQATGLVEGTGERGRYRLGARILYFAAVMHRRGFNQYAREHARGLARVTRETTHATMYDDPYSVTILIVEGEAPVGPRVLLGSRRPLHASASGKTYLAHEQERVVDAYLAGGPEALTATTITSTEVLRLVLVEVRAQGYGVDQGESYHGICGVAAPVFEFTGQVVGCLSLTTATSRLEPSQARALASPLCESATALSTHLGWVPRPREAGGR